MARPDAREIITWYEEAKSIRSPYENDWRMCAAHCVPRHYAMWQVEGPVTQPSTAPRRIAYDNTGVRSIPKYISILQRLVTPDNQKWHGLEASDPSLNKSYTVRVFFDNLTNYLFKMRRNPKSLFAQTRSEMYGSIGVYGMGPYSVTWRKRTKLDPKGGISYKAWHLKNIFVLVDDEGRIWCIFRRLYLNVRQFRIKFPNESVPLSMQAEDKKNIPSENAFFEFVQCLHHREDYDEKSLTPAYHPICESYVSVRDAVYVGAEAGYQSMPLLTPRALTEADDIYGYSPALQALPAMGGVSAMKKTVLKQGQKAVDPALLAADDGVISGRVDIRPGRITPGAVNAQGQRLIIPLESGNFKVAENLIEGERNDIEDSFFVTLFRILEENPSMTATQVVELMATRGTLLAPTMGRLQAEDIGPMIEREILLLAENNMLVGDLAMPPELIEARGQYEITYTSPLAKAMNAEEAKGVLTWTDWLTNMANLTKDPRPLDHIVMDEAAPFVAQVLSVPTKLQASPEQLAAVRKQREAQQQEQAMVDQAPAIASVVNTAMKQNGGAPPGVTNS